MSILIKGMEMPTSCYECPCNKDDGFGFFTCGVTKSECDFRNLPSDCPLIEVPPHGRLIDADAPIPLVDTHGKKIEVTVAHIIENNLGIVNAIIESEASR